MAIRFCYIEQLTINTTFLFFVLYENKKKCSFSFQSKLIYFVGQDRLCFGEQTQKYIYIEYLIYFLVNGFYVTELHVVAILRLMSFKTDER